MASILHLKIPPRFFQDLSNLVTTDDWDRPHRSSRHLYKCGLDNQRHPQFSTNFNAKTGCLLNVHKCLIPGSALATAAWDSRYFRNPNAIFILIKSDIKFHFRTCKTGGPNGINPHRAIMAQGRSNPFLHFNFNNKPLVEHILGTWILVQKD